MVPSNPTYDDMKKVVSEQQKRPLVPNKWTENSVSNQFFNADLHNCQFIDRKKKNALFQRSTSFRTSNSYK